ncbi:peptidase M48 Ste24p [Alsobacter soli]|uniref:Peptidase M48 Ste24p n=1 Tax=Alsobacter soli TaxID=2109933 RepID=A0A2T1HP91_9HYPH|nr:M48 family metallopeptidase [Alsobacter soli]PSC03339.1 peptidase M48 Ste24p [Alsobacter soli]
MNPVFGLYTHIRANRIRSVFMLAALVGLVYLLVFAAALLGEAMGGDAGLDELVRRAGRDLLAAAPLATLGVALWVLLAYKFHQKLIDAVTGARGVTRTEEPRLYAMLENLCISRGMPMPRLEILPGEALNAYATGLNAGQYAITVTTALRDALTDAEMEAVLGHELTHIRNEDVRMMVVAVVIAGVISFFAELIFRVLSNIRWSGGSARSSSSGDGDSREKGSGGAFAAVLIGLALIALAWLLSQLIRFGLSRSREFLADAGAVELTKNPDAMISALLKISGRGEIEGVPSGVMELCVDNPRSGFADLFATHPPIEARIDALVRYAGGRLPTPAAPSAPPDPGPAAQTPQAPGTFAGPWGTGMKAGPWGPRG